MNIAIGIDLVEVKRFELWATYRTTILRRVYSQDELSYCLANPLKIAERLAARFAAKEALYKALTQLYGYPPCSLISLLRHASVEKSKLYPSFMIQWNLLNLKPAHTLLSLSHTSTLAIAQVLITFDTKKDYTLTNL